MIKHSILLKNPKYDGHIKRALASMAYKIFDKKNSGKTVKNEITSNKELSEELHKPIIKENKRKEKYNHFL